MQCVLVNKICMDMIYTAVLEMILKGYEYILPIKKKSRFLSGLASSVVYEGESVLFIPPVSGALLAILGLWKHHRNFCLYPPPVFSLCSYLSKFHIFRTAVGLGPTLMMSFELDFLFKDARYLQISHILRY